MLVLSVFEKNHPPVFRVAGTGVSADGVTVETVRPDGTRQSFTMRDRGGYLQSAEDIPEPHGFTVHLSVGGKDYSVLFEEHEHGHGTPGSAYRDNNMRAAIAHVVCQTVRAPGAKVTLAVVTRLGACVCAMLSTRTLLVKLVRAADRARSGRHLRR